MGRVRFTERLLKALKSYFNLSPSNGSAPDVAKRGQYGENAAVQMLRGKGYKILHRNWRCRVGELDIIATFKGELVIVEVKSAGKESEFKPEFRVGFNKQKRIKRLTGMYMRSEHIDLPVRYDIVSVVWTKERIQVEHFENAYR